MISWASHDCRSMLGPFSGRIIPRLDTQVLVRSNCASVNCLADCPSSSQYDKLIGVATSYAGVASSGQKNKKGPISSVSGSNCTQITQSDGLSAKSTCIFWLAVFAVRAELFSCTCRVIPFDSRMISCPARSSSGLEISRLAWS